MSKKVMSFASYCKYNGADECHGDGYSCGDCSMSISNERLNTFYNDYQAYLKSQEEVKENKWLYVHINEFGVTFSSHKNDNPEQNPEFCIGRIRMEDI